MGIRLPVVIRRRRSVEAERRRLARLEETNERVDAMQRSAFAAEERADEAWRQAGQGLKDMRLLRVAIDASRSHQSRVEFRFQLSSEVLVDGFRHPLGGHRFLVNAIAAHVEEGLVRSPDWTRAFAWENGPQPEGVGRPGA